MMKSIVERKTSFNWYLLPHPLYLGQKHKLDWRTINWPEKSSKHQRDYLLRSAKSLMDALIQHLLQLSSSPSPLTVINKFYRLRKLVDWMLCEGKYRFSQLTEDDLIRYLQTLRSRNNLDLPSKVKSLKTHVSQLQLMWVLRNEYLSSLRVNLVTIEDEILVGVPTVGDGKWHALPDHVALPLVRNAMHWINDIAPQIQDTLSSINANLPSLVGNTKKKNSKIVTKIYKLLEKEGKFKYLRDELNDTKSSSTSLLRKGISMAEGAGITTILFFVGMRSSELCSINAIGQSEIQHSDGNYYSYLNGIAAKSGGKARRWVAAEPVIKAVHVLENLYQNFIPKTTSTPLLNSFSGNGAFPLPGRRIGRMHGDAIGKSLRTFAEATLSEFEKYKLDIHPHAARKTFGRFVVRRDKTALESVAYHYGHIHWLVTDSHYIGNDIDLEELLDEENREELARCFTDLLSSKGIAGKAGAAMNEIRDSMNANSSFRGKKSLTAVVEGLISRGVQLAPCNWGYCVYTKALSACEGDDKGPNEVKRAPTICGSCSNFAVTERHRLFWESRSESDHKFLLREGIPDQARDWVQKRAIQTDNLLNELNQKRFK